MIFFLFFTNACTYETPASSSLQPPTNTSIIFDLPPFATPQSGVSLVIGYTGRVASLADYFTPTETELFQTNEAESPFFTSHNRVISVDRDPVVKKLGDHLCVDIINPNCFEHLSTVLAGDKIATIYILHLPSWYCKPCLERIAELFNTGLIESNAQIFCAFAFEPCFQKRQSPSFLTRNLSDRYNDHASMFPKITQAIENTARALNIYRKTVEDAIIELTLLEPDKEYFVEAQTSIGYLFMQFFTHIINSDNIGIPITPLYFSSTANPVNGRYHTFWLCPKVFECNHFITACNASYASMTEETGHNPSEIKAIRTRRQLDLYKLIQAYLNTCNPSLSEMSDTEKRRKYLEVQSRYDHFLEPFKIERPRGG